MPATLIFLTIHISSAEKYDFIHKILTRRVGRGSLRVENKKGDRSPHFFHHVLITSLLELAQEREQEQVLLQASLPLS